MSGDDLLYQVEQNIAYLTINREPQRNAISAEVVNLFFKYLDEAENTNQQSSFRANSKKHVLVVDDNELIRAFLFDALSKIPRPL